MKKKELEKIKHQEKLEKGKKEILRNIKRLQDEDLKETEKKNFKRKNDTRNCRK